MNKADALSPLGRTASIITVTPTTQPARQLLPSIPMERQILSDTTSTRRWLPSRILPAVLPTLNGVNVGISFPSQILRGGALRMSTIPMETWWHLPILLVERSRSNIIGLDYRCFLSMHQEIVGSGSMMHVAI